jgi:hypothetical protein
MPELKLHLQNSMPSQPLSKVNSRQMRHSTETYMPNQPYRDSLPSLKKPAETPTIDRMNDSLEGPDLSGIDDNSECSGSDDPEHVLCSKSGDEEENNVANQRARGCADKLGAESRQDGH